LLYSKLTKFGTAIRILPVFTALHTMRGGIIHERNIRSSICPSLKRVNCDKRKKLLPKFLQRIKGPFI